MEEDQTDVDNQKPKEPEARGFSMWDIGVIVIVLGIVAGILFIVAGIQLYSHGQELTKLQSQAGDTVAEAYFQQVGYSMKAQALAGYGMGAAVIAVSVGLGARLMKKSP